MSLFGGNKITSLIGVDISSSGIKFVEVSKDKKSDPRLETYGYAEYPVVNGVFDPMANLKETAKLLARVVTEAGAKSKRVVAGIPMSDVFTSIITIPSTAEKEIKIYVEQQAQKLVSLPISEVQLDWKVLPNPGKDKHIRALVSGTKKAIIQKYVDLFQLAGLQLVSLEPEAFAITRSLVGKDLSTIMVVDLGSTRSHFYIIEKQIPVMTRVMNVGGSQITKTLADMLGVKPEEAEQLKRDMQSLGEIGSSGMPKGIERVLEPILHDLEYIFNEYNQGQTESGALIEKIVLTGGSSVLPNLVDYVRNRLQVNAYIGDPFSRIAFPQQLTSEIDQLGPRFAVASGLALYEEI